MYSPVDSVFEGKRGHDAVMILGANWLFSELFARAFKAELFLAVVDVDEFSGEGGSVGFQFRWRQFP